MVKFVWLEVGDGARIPVNPDQVRYLKRTREGKTAIVFSAMPGGFDELVLEMDAEEAVEALECPSGRAALDRPGSAATRAAARPGRRGRPDTPDLPATPAVSGSSSAR